MSFLQERSIEIVPLNPSARTAVYALVYWQNETALAAYGVEPLESFVNQENILTSDFVLWMEVSFSHLTRCESGVCNVGFSLKVNY